MSIFSLEAPSLLIFDELDSTNAEAKRMINNGFAEQGDIIFANKQQKGQGRLGREWYSPAGNFYLSFILQPDFKIEQAAQLSFVSALATLATIGKYLPANLQKQLCCKWPNDILLEGQKLSGILLESQFNLDHDFWLVIGLGINLQTYPKNSQNIATSLSEYGIDVAANNLIYEFLVEFNKYYDLWLTKKFKEIRKIWLENAFGIDKEIQIKPENDIINGFFRDIDQEGNLVMEIDNKLKKINSGEIFFHDCLAKNKVTKLF